MHVPLWINKYCAFEDLSLVMKLQYRLDVKTKYILNVNRLLDLLELSYHSSKSSIWENLVNDYIID